MAVQRLVGARQLIQDLLQDPPGVGGGDEFTEHFDPDTLIDRNEDRVCNLVIDTEFPMLQVYIRSLADTSSLAVATARATIRRASL